MAVLAADDEDFIMETRDASPAHLLIKIESFSLLSNHGIEKYESREFQAGGYKWRLIIHPDGLINSEDEEDHISVYLTIVGSSSLAVGWEVNAIFNIFLYNQILDNYVCFRGKTRRFHALKSQWGFSKLISKESLRDPSNGFLVDDNCVFGAEVFVIKNKRVIECVSLPEVTNQYKHKWKISEFSKVGKVWTSEEFSIGDHKWNVILYPNGGGNEVGRKVSMFLTCKSFGPHEKLKVDYCLCIKNQLNDHHLSRNCSYLITASQPSWGVPAFMPIADMQDPNKGFLVDDCCYVEIEITMQVVVHSAN